MKHARTRRPLVTMAGLSKVRTPTQVAGGWRLQPANGRIATTVVLGFVAAFWNGIVWFLLIQALQGGLAMASVAILFLGVFALIGAGIGAIFVLTLLKALFTPVPSLELASDSIDPLRSTAVRWSFSGNRPLLDLRISLVLREECQYRRGTDTLTDRHQVRERILFEHPEPARDGTVSVTIPADLPPSFAAKNNQLLWCLRLSARVPRLPDVDDEFPLLVRPAAANAATVVATPLPAGTVLPAATPALALAEGTAHGSAIAGIVHLPGRDVQLRLRWSTSGKGDSDSERLGDTPIPGGISGFFITLPSLPPAWSGTILSITWHLEACAGKQVLASVRLPNPPPPSDAPG